METSAINIAGLQLIDEIGRGAHSTVYRGRRNQRDYAIKIMRRVSADLSEAKVRFRREAGVLARVRHPGLARIMEVGEVDDQPYLVMEYVSGRTLGAYIADGELSESQILYIAKTVAGALAEVHRRGLVHRDIKPSNIIIDEAGIAKLIDFGFAIHAASSDTDPEDGHVVGTFVYSAPEQTGMLRRPIDGRADLYALGAVLFECATGFPPFVTQEVGELIRMHATLPAPPVRQFNPTISPALAAVIAKLLAKDPDDRYQRGEGLLADLDNLASLNAAFNSGQTEVVLGSADAFSKSLYESPLVGRDAELSQLQEAWRAAVRGNGQFVYLSGDLGSGKSRLVRELLHSAESGGALTLRGRCLENDPQPFAPLREAIDRLLRNIQKLPEMKKQQSEKRIHAAAGVFAPLLNRFSPLMSTILGAAESNLSSTAILGQFHEAIAHFILQLAVHHSASILFLDDVQWLDFASRQVLRHLIAKADAYPILIIIASDGGSAPEDSDWLTQLTTLSTSFTSLHIDLLDEKAIGALVADYLGGYQIDSQTVRQLAVRSNGNALAVQEYLDAMIDAGVLRPSWGSWVVDQEGLEEIKLPDNVVDLALRRLAELSAESRRILTLAAVIGSRFAPDLLLPLANTYIDNVQTALVDGVAMHLIEARSTGDYTFIHDRIRDALLSGLDTAAQRDLHQHIAVVLDQQATDANGTVEADILYQIAFHYARGHITQVPERAYASNLEAGHYAAANYAYERAYAFLQQAAQIHAMLDRPPDPALDDALSSICLRTGRTAEALTYIENGLSYTTDPLTRARLLARMARLQIKKRQNKAAWTAVERGFITLNRPAPKASWSHLPLTLGSWSRWAAAKLIGWGFGSAEPAERVQLQVVAQLYEAASYLATMGDETALQVETGLRPLYSAYRLGPSRELAFAYANYAWLLSRFGWKIAAEKLILQATHISQGLNDRTALGHVLHLHARIRLQTGDVSGAEQIARHCLENYGESLDAYDLAATVDSLIINLVLRGYLREGWRWTQFALERSERTGINLFIPYAGAIQAALGRPSEGLEHLETAEALFDTYHSPVMRHALLLASRILYLVEQNDLGEPLDEAIAEFNRLDLKSADASEVARFAYIAIAYGRLAQAQNEIHDNWVVRAPQVREAINQLQEASNSPVHDCHWLTIKAAFSSLEGNLTKALRLLAQAEEIGVEHDCLWVIYEIARWRAYTLKADERPRSASQQAQIAYNLAVTNGWVNRARAIRSQFHLDDLPESQASLRFSHSSTTSSSSSDAVSIRLQRYLEALLQVSLASVNVLDPHQQARAALDEVIDILGAERGFLFLVDADNEELSYLAGRNAQKETLPPLSGYSHTVVEQVRLTRKPLIVSGTEEGAVMGAHSVITHNIRSILVVPLLLRERLVGVAYLDNRLVRGVFNEEDVQILLAIGNHIAISLQITHMIEVIRERTADLQNTYNQLEKLDQTKSDFISIVSHELRTPLTVLDGYCQMLMLDPVVVQHPHLLEFVRQIRHGSIRLGEIIDTTLDMAKLDSRLLQIEPQRVSIAEILEKVMGKLTAAMQERSLTVRFDLPKLKRLPSIEADPTALYKVFYNLVVNAIKYTPDGGVIAVMGRTVEEGEFGLSEDGIKIVVSDTGIGIDSEDQDLIFTKFYNTGEVALHSSSKTNFKGGGPGLGLSIVKGVVEAHSGFVWVESAGYDEELCPGSRFHVVLPLTQHRLQNGGRIIPDKLV